MKYSYTSAINTVETLRADVSALQYELEQSKRALPITQAFTGVKSDEARRAYEAYQQIVPAQFRVGYLDRVAVKNVDEPLDDLPLIPRRSDLEADRELLEDLYKVDAAVGSAVFGVFHAAAEDTYEALLRTGLARQKLSQLQSDIDEKVTLVEDLSTSMADTLVQVDKYTPASCGVKLFDDAALSGYSHTRQYMWDNFAVPLVDTLFYTSAFTDVVDGTGVSNGVTKYILGELSLEALQALFVQRDCARELFSILLTVYKRMVRVILEKRSERRMPGRIQEAFTMAMEVYTTTMCRFYPNVLERMERGSIDTADLDAGFLLDWSMVRDLADMAETFVKRTEAGKTNEDAQTSSRGAPTASPAKRPREKDTDVELTGDVGAEDTDPLVVRHRIKVRIVRRRVTKPSDADV